MVPGLYEFIIENIHSVEHLEILLLLRKHNHRTWTAEEISQELRNNPSSGMRRLNDLSAKGLVVPVPDRFGAYRYEPKTEHLSQMVNRLADEYACRRIRVIDAIYTKPTAANDFAKAFKLRKDT